MRKVSSIAFVLSCFFALAQQSPFDIEGNEGHWVDSVNSLVTDFRSAQSAEEQLEIRDEVLGLLKAINTSSADSISKSMASYRGYRIWDKRADFEIYTGILKDVERWAPRDSVKLRFFSNYQIGNTFIFKEAFDSASYYLHEAFKIDIEHELGPYEGAVQDRAALILYKLEDYEHSLQMTNASLRTAKGRLRAAVYNQLGNTYNMAENYSEAATAYDSASALYEASGVRNWMPKFNSLTAYLELGDSEKFLEVYNAIKDEQAIQYYDTYYQTIEVAKAEFSLTYWQDSARYNTEGLEEIILPRTTENERIVRQILQSQIAYTEGEWQTNRDAYFLLKRWYDLARPDSSVYAMKQMLSIDSAYRLKLAAETSTEEDINQNLLATGELKRLIAAIGREELLQSFDKSNRTSQGINQLIYTLIFAALFLVFLLYVLRRSWDAYKQRRTLITDLRTLQKREEELLYRIVPYQSIGTDKKAPKAVTKRYDNIIVLAANFNDFNALSPQLDPDEFITTLEDGFSRLKDVCEEYGLQKIRTEECCFIAAGGFNEEFASPRMTLNAALAMQKAVKERKAEIGGPETTLSIGIDMGPLDSGVLESSGGVYGVWGDVFRRAKDIAAECPSEEVALSKASVDAESTGTAWPKSTSKNTAAGDIRIFKA
ncbi:MAG: adenylate/guanylate cyclase domain-containing protein [Schleiferiaceae bacterium]